MEIVTANKEFNGGEFHVSLMTCGVYIFHDPLTENLVDKENIVWEEELSHHGYTGNNPAIEKFTQLQANKILEYFPNLFVYNPALYYGIDTGAGNWHTDSKENLIIQAIGYQEDLYPEDGGSLRIKCYDSVERWYYPKNGDVLILSHKPHITHMVEKIISDKKRIAMNIKFKKKNT